MARRSVSASVATADGSAGGGDVFSAGGLVTDDRGGRGGQSCEQVIIDDQDIRRVFRKCWCKLIGTQGFRGHEQNLAIE